MVRDGEIPAQAVAKQPWSARLLFPARAMMKSIGKVLVTPTDFLLVLLVVAIVFVELFADGSWMLYAFSMLVLAANAFERHQLNGRPPVEKKPKEETITT